MMRIGGIINLFRPCAVKYLAATRACWGENCDRKKLKWEDLVTNNKLREQVEKAQKVPAPPSPPSISEAKLKELNFEDLMEQSAREQEDQVMEEMEKTASEEQEVEVMEEMARVSMRCPSPVPALAETNGAQMLCPSPVPAVAETNGPQIRCPSPVPAC